MHGGMFSDRADLGRCGVYRIRFHGRGGQGVKTAGRIMGTALFLQGFEVQDAPRYGAERRGAPIFAYVRAARGAINERGIIRHPDLVVVTDRTLVGLPVAGVATGADASTVTLINSDEPPEVWKEKLRSVGCVLSLPRALDLENADEVKQIGAACAGAGLRLLGVVGRESVEHAVRQELGGLGPEVVTRNLEAALEMYDAMAPYEGVVKETVEPPALGYAKPDWIDLPFDDFGVASPAIHAAATSVEVRTGLWRTMRPVLDRERCSRCWWNCVTSCPDGAMEADPQGFPLVDYDHCKGCLICVAQCRRRALLAVPEREAQAREAADAGSKGTLSGNASKGASR